MSQLSENARAGIAGYYLQFGGQGAPWLKELSAYFGADNHQKFFSVVFDALKAERGRVEGTVGLPQGIDLETWLKKPESVPDEDYLGCAAVSIPMIQVTQLAHFEFLTSKSGYERKTLIGQARGATGHSQGLIPAALVSMAHNDSEYYEHVAQFVKYLLYLGVRAQEAFPYFAATEAEMADSLALDSKNPAPMVAVLGETHEFIGGLVKEVNATLPADKQIYISLYNSPVNRILSSFRSSLIAFNKRIKPLIDEKKIKFVYLRTTCPFHCSLMEPVRPLFEADIKRLGFSYPGSDLKIPVYSFWDGRNMQNDTDLAIPMYIDMAINALYWDKSIDPAARDSKVTHIIDFGPGKTSQRLTQDTLESLAAEKSVLAVAVPKDQKELFS
ncbi:MAG: ACP S-malonyltransferase [Spirochaetales bacterium]|nr:ACP S-malonyltransferase [Spirochaetales bacterium]